MDYGLILFGTSNVYHYVIVNYGNQVIQLSNFNLSNPSILSFTGSSGSNATLNPGEALGIDIDLHPVAAGPVNETLTFQTSVSSLPNVSIPITAQASAVGLQNICNTNETDVYPNPAVDKVFIKWNSSAMSCNVKIYDAMGNVIIQNQKVTKDNFEMDLSHLNQGIYFIHIEMPGNIEVRRLTIIR